MSDGTGEHAARGGSLHPASGTRTPCPRSPTATLCQRVGISDRRGATLEVIAREVGAPLGVKAIEWRLLTNRAVEMLEAAVELVDWYRARWEIEMLFLALKEGCRIEALQLSAMERLERALALFLVVSWRIARLMRLGRTVPDLDASLLLETEEWQAAYILVKKPVPK